MQITNIRCYVFESPSQNGRFAWRVGLPGSGDGAASNERTAILRMDTDAGITGITRAPRGDQVADLTRRRFKSLIGENPLNTERLWTVIWEMDRIEEFQINALGLIDLLAWDIKSKRSGLPLYQMIGGNDPIIPAYASTVTWPDMDTFERNIKLCLDVGFEHFKLHAWGDVKEDALLARNLRKWAGPDAKLMFDGSAGWDYVDALRLGRVLEDEDYFWYEEPMREFDISSYTRLTERLDIPVLACETSDGCHWNAAQWIANKSLNMMRISSHLKGGVTGALKIAHLAESFGMRAQVHAMGRPNLHLAAAISNNDFYEQIVIDEDHIRSLQTADVAVINGQVTAPDTPGIEPELDWDEIEATAVAVI